ncbi:glycosyltransferase [Candidatus Kaiserbacteria bacterium]|nr:glycosyltransferase [Candidatus Kaiserbacteria bacterium]
MKILLTTQVVDEKDPYLSFFVLWLKEFSRHFQTIHVVCLKEGTHSLPGNVRVHSLGKPSFAKATEGAGRRIFLRLQYISRLLWYAWTLRSEYDAVFVHMNQEYVLIAGVLWKLLGKQIYLWRNHYAGDVRTDIAALLCKKVFCTSKFSHTAKYKKTVLMPVGVDTDRFQTAEGVERVSRSVLFFGRFAPSKKPDLLVSALKELTQRGVQFFASFYGSALPADQEYREQVMEDARSLTQIQFFEGIPNAEAPRTFSAHDIYVDLGRSGMYNKTIFEAAACGCLVLAASKDFAELVDPQFSFREDGSDLSRKLQNLLALSDLEREDARTRLRTLAESQSLSTLGTQLAIELA